GLRADTAWQRGRLHAAEVPGGHAPHRRRDPHPATGGRAPPPVVTQERLRRKTVLRDVARLPHLETPSPALASRGVSRASSHGQDQQEWRHCATQGPTEGPRTTRCE